MSRKLESGDEDLQLAKGCAKNDARSQQRVFEKYYGLMLAICQRYCQNQEDARDVLQEAFLKVFEKIAQYDEKRSFLNWMKRIVINTAIDRYRQDVRSPTMHDEHQLLNAPVDSAALSDLGEEDLIKCIQRLPSGYRTVFNMYVIEGYSHKEIGERLGIAEGTSKSQLAKAKSILRKRVESLNRINYENEQERYG